jgi:flagellar assembly protein FliH
MKWSEAIALTHPLSNVRLRATLSPEQAEERQRAAEQAAYERGRRDGEKALSEQLLQQRNELLELHQGVLDSLNRAVPQVVRDAENALINLALESAQKIVAGLPVSREMIEAVIREAIGQVEDSVEITVHLNPDDLALLRKYKSPVLQGTPDSGPLRFISSAEVTRGGCLVQTKFGLLDARRETKLEQLKETLEA